MIRVVVPRRTDLETSPLANAGSARNDAVTNMDLQNMLRPRLQIALPYVVHSIVEVAWEVVESRILFNPRAAESCARLNMLDCIYEPRTSEVEWQVVVEYEFPVPPNPMWSTSTGTPNS